MCYLWARRRQHAVIDPNWDGKKNLSKGHALVYVLPTHVQERHIEVARVGIQCVLYLLSFPPGLQSELGRVFPRVRVLPEASCGKIPEQHATTIQRPYRVLWRLRLVVGRGALGDFAGEQ